jgi:type II secretory pathway component GspD/PulD (secretin)
MQRRLFVWAFGPALITIFAVVVSLSIPFNTSSFQMPDEDVPLSVMITLDADDISLTSVLQILAEKSGMNIVTSPEVQAQRISIHLRNVPIDDALNLVVRAAGLGYERLGNSILVGDPEKLKEATGVVSEVIPLQYAHPEDVRQLLTDLTPNVRSQVDTLGSKVVVTTTPSIMEQVRAIVAELDIPPPQVQLKARVVEVSSGDMAEIGVDYERLLDGAQTIITESTPSASSNNEAPPIMPYVNLSRLDFTSRQAEAFEVALDLLLSEERGRLLADSELTTLSNRSAKIHVGDVVRVVVTSIVTERQAGVATGVGQLEEIETGITLNVTPRVSDDGFITVEVNPTVSQIVAFRGIEQDIPQTRERTARTSIRVKDGEVIYIGGLQNHISKDTVVKVPLLGDLPLLGRLFRHYSTSDEWTELIIEIVPNILES